MENYRQGGAKTSPGFVYFNTEETTPPNKKECSDFIGFNSPPPQALNSTPPRGGFRAPEYGSPRGHRGRGNPGFVSPKFQKNWQQNRFGSPNEGSSDNWGGSSPNWGKGSYRGNNSNWGNSPNRGHNSSWGNSSNFSPGGGQNRNQSWRGGRGNGRGGFNNRHSMNKIHDIPFDAKKFLHPSFMEDPWAELEKQHKKKKELERLQAEMEKEKIEKEESEDNDRTTDNEETSDDENTLNNEEASENEDSNKEKHSNKEGASNNEGTSNNEDT